MARDLRPSGLRRLRRAFDRLEILRGPGADAARQSFVALVLNSTTSLVAGAVLGAITGTLEKLPGLLVLVPAAIGLRGNVFSALGNRLSTAIHVGTFRLSARPETLLGQNIAASMALTLSMSLALAVIAKVVAVALGIPNTISVLELALISVVGGLLASLFVLVATVFLAAGSVRYELDLDNLVAPLVSTLGDVLTLPALWLATFLVEPDLVAEIGGPLVAAGAALSFVLAVRSGRDLLQRIVRESAPILMVAGGLSTMAGVAIEKRIGTFAAFPALLVLVPAFISSAGALGGILASRLATKLHLGVIAAESVPSSTARWDAGLVAMLAVPVYVLNGIGAHVVAGWLGERSPGLGHMVAASVGGGLFTVLFVVTVAYYGSVAAFRVGVDPDTYGIPIVTSSVDFVGAVALVVTIAALGIV
jgi:mgtE-like transporter